MKLRIKHIDGVGFFPQAKHGLFGAWKRIGKHTDGYGLYPSEWMDHPMATQFEAMERAKMYEQWFVNGGNRVTYIDV